MSDHALAFWWTAPMQGELRREPLRRPGDDEVLVRTLVSGVSRGTEALVAKGAVPESEWQRMRCPHQGSDFPFPVKYGYACVGVVEAGPAALLGRTVFCLHPHQTAFVVPVTDVLPLPAGVSIERAVLAANAETALNALWDAPALPGQRIVVLGAGVVGCLTAWLASRLPGAEVTLVDRDPRRGSTAAALGLAFALPEAAPADADLVVEATGNPAALSTALALTGFEAKIMILSWYGEQRAEISFGGEFHSRRLQVLASQVGEVASAMRSRWSRRRRLAKALQLLTDPVLDVLVADSSLFSRLPEQMPAVVSDLATLCHRVTYEDLPDV